MRLLRGSGGAVDEKELPRCWVHVSLPLQPQCGPLCPQLALGSPSTKSSRATEALLRSLSCGVWDVVSQLRIEPGPPRVGSTES